MSQVVSDRSRTLWSRLKSFFLITDGSARNAAMEGLRGYAVLLVVFIHALGLVLYCHRGIDVLSPKSLSVWILLKDHSKSDTTLFALAMGHYAVDLFFLLSAFLITRIVLKQQASFSYVSYVKKRFLRIYPPFLTALLASLAVHVWWMQRLPFRWDALVENLFFLNGCPGLTQVMTYNPPTWSLFYEFSFYLVFPLMFFLWTRSRAAAGAGPFICSILLLAVALLSNSYMPRSCTFLFGMLLGARGDDELRQIARGLPTWLVASIYLSLIAAYALVSQDWGWFSPAFSVGISMLFLKTCYDEGPLNWLFTRLPLRFLGNISFSLYLTHSLSLPIIEFQFDAAKWQLHPLVDAFVVFLVSLSMSVVFSVILFATVERWHFRKAALGQRPRLAAPEMADAKPLLAA